MDSEAAIEVLIEMINEEVELSADLSVEGKEKSDRYIRAMEAGIKALELNKLEKLEKLKELCTNLVHFNGTIKASYILQFLEEDN